MRCIPNTSNQPSAIIDRYIFVIKVYFANLHKRNEFNYTATITPIDKSAHHPHPPFEKVMPRHPLREIGVRMAYHATISQEWRHSQHRRNPALSRHHSAHAILIGRPWAIAGGLATVASTCRAGCPKTAPTNTRPSPSTYRCSQFPTRKKPNPLFTVVY